MLTQPGVLGLSPNVQDVLAKYGAPVQAGMQGGGSLGNYLMPASSQNFLPAAAALPQIQTAAMLPPRTPVPGMTLPSQLPPGTWYGTGGPATPPPATGGGTGGKGGGKGGTTGGGTTPGGLFPGVLPFPSTTAPTVRPTTQSQRPTMADLLASSKTSRPQDNYGYNDTFSLGG